MKRRTKSSGRRTAAFLILIFIAAAIFVCLFITCGRGGREGCDYDRIYVDLIDSAIPGDSSEEIYDDFAKMKDRSSKPSQQEIAQIISAETMHYAREKNARSCEIVRQGAKYLLDLRTDYPSGYGCYFEWDAGSDGSVNPANTSYAITNAAVLDAFIDAVDAGILDKEDTKRAESAIHDIVIGYCENYFTAVNGSEGYFWYSDQKTDDMDCPNASSSFAGAAAKAMSKYPEIFSTQEKALIGERVSMVQKRLTAQAGRKDGALFWYYREGSRSPNELIHMCFILEGLRDIREYGAGYDWAWSEKDEKNSIDKYYYGNELHRFTEYQNINDSADLYGFGGAVEYYAKTGRTGKAKSIADEALSSFEGLENGEYENFRQETFFIRGMAEYLYGERS